MLEQFIQQHQLPEGFARTAEQWFIPVAKQLSSQRPEQSPFFIGINGCQGSGKSTLADFLSTYFKQRLNLSVAVLSLDDFYLPSAKRAELADTIHPLLATRGVPGTHNVTLMKKVFDTLSNRQTTKLPRFDKATDDPLPQSQWPEITQPEIVIFEGWCWGVKPQSQLQLASPINALEENEDIDGKWRNYVNQQLTNFLPFYKQMHCWLMLKAPNFDCVAQWRWQQEQKLRQKVAKPNNSKVMNEQQIARFIQHFERLTSHAIARLPVECDYVFELASDRAINALRSMHAI
ncbi:kinase [Thalassotalea sp. LPB0316]|uniref:kinase n=1 Tax=Thalassotalea sp. LPB0316 TaxID=2769490 RepID=UPI0018686442|nr:kinase [Thalassotalea sp. LPB0316]QOL26554.1 kinase [Thalassotalea sp. LPB0316]